MEIRPSQPGDEAAQVAIYNNAAGDLPRFKPATLDELRRRYRAPDFDPALQFFAVENGEIIGYAGFRANGRVTYPWCKKGREQAAGPLFQRVLQGMRTRGITRAFAAYRADWAVQHDFFLARGFHKAREMVNLVLDLGAMPTTPARRGTSFAPLQPEDLPALAALCPAVLRTTTPAALEQYYFRNPRLQPEWLFALRGRADLIGAGVVILDNSFADPKQVDPGMPCFRLGAFGTEGMQTKRIQGLFSFLARPEEIGQLGLDMMGYAALKLQETSCHVFAAQVPSDVPYLLEFYERHFVRQGSFPVLERTL
jgi:hypothetical protein